MLRTLQATIRRHDLLASGAHWLLAVSGGADSMSLLAALHELAPPLGLRLTVAHLDHRLRGASSRADADHVRQVCGRLGIPVIGAAADVRRTARRHGISIEMAARRCRHRFFAQALRRAGADAVVTAHTRDDQVETILLRLTRGAGARGLCAMTYRGELNGLPLLRPLLDVSRRQVIRFLRRRGLVWREDASNAETVFLRNRVRHEILPLLRARLNPRVDAALLRTADVLREEDAFLNELARQAYGVCRCAAGGIDTGRFGGYAPAIRRRVLQVWVADAGGAVERLDYKTLTRMDRLLNGNGGSGTVPLAAGWHLRRTYRQALIERGDTTEPAGFRVALRLRGVTELPGVFRVRSSVAPGICRETGHPGRLPAAASLSREAVGRSRLFVRSWRPGDRMRPIGMRGSRKLQDIFVDAKIPRRARARIPVVTCREQIVWLPGYRIARGWEVPAADRPAVQLRVEALENV